MLNSLWKEKHMTKAIQKLCKYYLLMSLICMAVFTNKNAYRVFASEGNPYPHSYTEYDEEGNEIYHPGNCTWQAWEECLNRLGIRLPSWGNGGSWHLSVEQAGYSYAVWEVGSHYENCLVEWNNHVAWLISSDDSGANIAEGNLRQDGEYRERVEKWWSWNDLKNRWGEGTPYIIFLNAPLVEETQEEIVAEDSVDEEISEAVDNETTDVTEEENIAAEEKENTDEQAAEIEDEEEQPVEETVSELDVHKTDMLDLLTEGTDGIETDTEENVEEEIQSPLDMQKAGTMELLTEGTVEPEAMEQNEIEEEPVTETDPKKMEMLSLLKEGFDEEAYLKKIEEEKAEELLKKEMLLKCNDLFEEEKEETKELLEYDVPSGGNCFIIRMELVK